MPANDEHGVLSVKSGFSVSETAGKLVDALQSHGMRIFARIDQRDAANQSGLEMRPMELILFGDPAAGTPLMLAHPSLAIDLPLKALVWEDASGDVRISYNSPVYLQQRHGLANPPFTAVSGVIEQSVKTE